MFNIIPIQEESVTTLSQLCFESGPSTTPEAVQLNIDGKNGLHKDLDWIKLGGELTEPETKLSADIASYIDYYIELKNSSTQRLSGFYMDNEGYADMWAYDNSDGRRGNVRLFPNNVYFFAENASGKTELNFGSSNNTLTDARLQVGLRYANDYSANNASNPRWIVDKGYVDGVVSSIPAINESTLVHKSGYEVLSGQKDWTNGITTTTIGTSLVSVNHLASGNSSVITGTTGFTAQDSGGFGGIYGRTSIQYSVSGASLTIARPGTITGVKTITYPNATGTVALLTDIPSATTFIQNQLTAVQTASAWINGTFRMSNAGDTVRHSFTVSSPGQLALGTSAAASFLFSSSYTGIFYMTPIYMSNLSAAASQPSTAVTFGSTSSASASLTTSLNVAGGDMKVLTTDAHAFSAALYAGKTKAGAPTTTDIPAGYYQVYKDSSGGTVKLWYNDGGTMKSVTLA